MSQTLELLKSMIAAPGLSGHERPIRKIVEAAWEPLTDELHTSRLGSLHGLKSGEAPAPRRSILIATHMDAIGLMVTSIKDGFLHITEIGGIDHRVLPGQSVTVHGSQELPGLVVQPPAHTLPEDAQSGPVPLEHLLVDVGLSPRQVENLVRVGDLVSFASAPTALDGDLLTGHSLDNRASIAALTEALRALQKRRHTWDVWAVASAQEEETLGGALTSAYQLRPSLAIAIDVTWASSHDTPSHKTFALNKGPTLGWGPNVHPKLFEAFKELAVRLEIPYHKELMPRMSGTDAIALQVAREGIPTMVVSIPLRYMHTPVEMVHLKDIQRTARLVTEFIAELDEEFMKKLRWDEDQSKGQD